MTNDTDQLIERARAGESQAQQALLRRHRKRLRRMIGVFLDPRISARVDPSDVLQEALTCAATRLPEYLEHRPIAFYPWLRQIVRNELINVHRLHVTAQRRAIGREQDFGSEVSDASAMQLANRLVGRETTPSQQTSPDGFHPAVGSALRILALHRAGCRLRRQSGPVADKA
jgi:RNA polymerase sigma-70 factor (ECF subfamily)